MQCHYCGYQEAVPEICPNCRDRQIRFLGTGTQKVQEELAELFPQAKIIRMDVDTTRRKGSYDKILTSFGQGEADILLGTQMIAKGLDFPNVTLVGVINADTGLWLPDYNASERTFELITQVAGRAGRADKEGQVMIQTYNPDHYAIHLAQKQDYELFFTLKKCGSAMPATTRLTFTRSWSPFQPKMSKTRPGRLLKSNGNCRGNCGRRLLS